MALKTYSTTFAATENPLSESGAWVNGGTTGLDWANFSSASGRAIGHQTGVNGADSTAILTDIWPADQECQATVFVDSVPPQSNAPELELRLRSKITAHTNRGYEILFGLNGYHSIARWDGALQVFTYLYQSLGTSTARFQLVTGDVIKARIVGGVISTYKNGVLMARVKDTTWTDGEPGIGANLEDGAGTGAGLNVNYGFTAFSATEIDSTLTPDVDVGGNGNDTATASLTTYLEKAIAAGDAIAVVGTWGDTNVSALSVDDGSSGANVYERVTAPDGAHGQATELWVCQRAKVAVAGQPTITMTLSASTGFNGIAVYRRRGRYVNGPRVPGAVVPTPSGTDSIATAAQIPVRPSVIVGLVVDTGNQRDKNFTAGTGFTKQIEAAGGIVVAIEDKTQTVAASATATFTPANSEAAVVYMVLLTPDPFSYDYTKFPKPLIARRAQGLS